MISTAETKGRAVASAFAQLLLVLVVVAGVARLPLSDAGFVASTSTASNSIETRTIDPPSAGAGVSTLVSVLPLRCRVDLSWTASNSIGVSGYVIQRLAPVTGALIDSWTTSGTTFSATVDHLGPSTWRIRSVSGSWYSTWLNVVVDYLLCNVL